MNTPRKTPRWAAAALAATLSVTALGACGSSGSTAKKDIDKAGATSPKDAGKSAVNDAGKDAGNDAFCNDWVAADAAGAQGPESGEAGPTPTQIAAFAKSLQAPVTKASKNAPAAVKAPVAKIVSIIDDAAAGKNPQALDPSGPTFGEPLSKVEAWVHTSCGFNKLDVMGVDYGYSGIPATIKPGVASIKFENMSDKEFHEMALMRIKDGSGVTSTELAAALEKDAAAAEQKYGDSVEPVGSTQAPPGVTGYTTVDLPAGDYVAVCFIPVGDKPDGVPHAQKGMVTAFKVA